jgi:hypothetical protein
MNRDIINEEIERLKLLMRYNTNKTLSENTVKIISEQGWKAALEDMSKVLAKDTKSFTSSLETAFKDGTMNWDRMVLENGTNLSKNKSIDELLGAIKTNTLGPSGVGSIAKGLFVKGSSLELRALGADGITSMSQFTKKYGKKSKDEIIETLINDAKYSKADAEMLADTFLKKRVNPNLITKLKGVLKPSGFSKTWIKFKPILDKMTRTKIFKYLLGAGGVYLVWMWWMDEGSKPFPNCIAKNMPEEDFKKMVELGLEYVIISETGVEEIDRYDGGKFWDDGHFETVKGDITGKWKQSLDGITITIHKNEYVMSCEGMVTKKECPEGQTWDGNKCVPIKTPPKPDEEITPVTPSPDEVTTTTTTRWRRLPDAYGLGDDAI